MKNRNFYEDLKVTEPKKLSIDIFTVNYYNPDGSFRNSEDVRPVPFMGTGGAPGLKELIELQEKIIGYIVWDSFAIGSMVCDPKGLDLLGKMAAMLCVVGKPTRGIDLKYMLEIGDYKQIGEIFLGEDYGSHEEGLHIFGKPSKIARIHNMDYWGKFREEGQKKQTADLTKLTEPTIVPIPPISTPLPAADIGTSISSPIVSKPMDLVPLS